jgi:hypothetical protein
MWWLTCEGVYMNTGRWVVTYFSKNGDIQTRFFDCESEARKYGEDLYYEFLIPADVCLV